MWIRGTRVASATLASASKATEVADDGDCDSEHGPDADSR